MQGICVHLSELLKCIIFLILLLMQRGVYGFVDNEARGRFNAKFNPLIDKKAPQIFSPAAIQKTLVMFYDESNQILGSNLLNNIGFKVDRIDIKTNESIVISSGYKESNDDSYWFGNFAVHLNDKRYTRSEVLSFFAQDFNELSPNGYVSRSIIWASANLEYSNEFIIFAKEYFNTETKYFGTRTHKLNELIINNEFHINTNYKYEFNQVNNGYEGSGLFQYAELKGIFDKEYRGNIIEVPLETIGDNESEITVMFFLHDLNWSSHGFLKTFMKIFYANILSISKLMQSKYLTVRLPFLDITKGEELINLLRQKFQPSKNVLSDGLDLRNVFWSGGGDNVRIVSYKQMNSIRIGNGNLQIPTDPNQNEKDASLYFNATDPNVYIVVRSNTTIYLSCLLNDL